VGLVGFIRNQRVAQIWFFPARHNPVAKSVEFFKRLRVKVSFVYSVVLARLQKLGSW